MNTRQGLITFDREQFASEFDRRAFPLRHGLAHHPLFELDRLVELSEWLPASKIEYNLGDLALDHNSSATPGNGLGVRETIERIDQCGSWLVLKHVQLHRDYEELLRVTLEPVRHQMNETIGEMFDLAAFIFISSPRAVTPYHMDPENNFLLQVRGAKTIRVFDREDRRVLSEHEIESFSSGGHRNLNYRDEIAPCGRDHILEAGDALHVPVYAPHHVRNGDGVSISFSITFRNRRSEKREAVYWTNNKLRRFRIAPRAPGSSALSDTMKHGVYRSLRGIKRVVYGKGA